MNNPIFSKYIEGNHKIIKLFGLKLKLKNPPPPISVLTDYLLNIAPHVSVPRIEIHISEHCNLNCQSCSHFSPIANPEFLSLEEFEKDIKRLSELTQKIGFINILGGEPLLNPKCCEYLETARKYFPDVQINLVTNGILLPAQKDSFYEDLAKNNITLTPTKYPIKVNWNKVKDSCKKYNVNLNFYNSEKVIKTSYKIPLDINGKGHEQINYLKCIFPGCIQLHKGRIYRCPIAAYIKHFNKFYNQNLEIGEGDYLDIYKIKDVQEILDYIIKPIPFCRHCVTNKAISGLKWQLSSKKIEEWIL